MELTYFNWLKYISPIKNINEICKKKNTNDVINWTSYIRIFQTDLEPVEACNTK